MKKPVAARTVQQQQQRRGLEHMYNLKYNKSARSPVIMTTIIDFSAIYTCFSIKQQQHPYPSEEQKKHLAQQTGLTILQVNNW